MRGDDGRYEGMLFDVGAPLEYFVEADGVRSAVFKLTVVDVPYVSAWSSSITSRPTPGSSRRRSRTAATSPC